LFSFLDLQLNPSRSLGMCQPCLPSLEVNPLHVIFYLNGVLVTTYFDRGGCRRTPSCTIIVMLELKNFLERYVAQFHLLTFRKVYLKPT
jgi:hypothetical protein